MSFWSSTAKIATSLISGAAKFGGKAVTTVAPHIRPRTVAGVGLGVAVAKTYHEIDKYGLEGSSVHFWKGHPDEQPLVETNSSEGRGSWDNPTIKEPSNHPQQSTNKEFDITDILPEGVQNFFNLFNGKSELSLGNFANNLNGGNILMGLLGGWLTFGNTGLLGKLIGGFLLINLLGKCFMENKTAQNQNQTNQLGQPQLAAQGIDGQSQQEDESKGIHR